VSAQIFPVMAGKKDDEAQKARAQRLRRQIAGGKAGAKRPPASPREFIEEKMREGASDAPKSGSQRPRPR
jgi:hypothetical protein